MELLEFKQHIESFPKGQEFNYTVSDPFSWRGDYAQVAFSVLAEKSTREEILEKINKAYTGKFYGYKGGEYTFSDYTYVNFESEGRDYTDGGYCSQWIAEIEGEKPYQSQEARLVNLMFCG